MKGFPVLVFFDGEFQYLALCPTSDCAKAFVVGAEVGASIYAAECHWDEVLDAIFLDLGDSRFVPEAFAQVVDGVVLDANAAITASERAKAVACLYRALSEPFPARTTIVK